jgi:hypothetical protein
MCEKPLTGSSFFFTTTNWSASPELRGSIEGSDWESVKKLDVGSWFGEAFSDQKPITMGKAIELCREGGAIALVEHKSGDAASYAKVISELKAEKDVIVPELQLEVSCGISQAAPRNSRRRTG